MNVFYSQTSEEVFNELKSSKQGLSATEIKKRRSVYGRNVLAEVSQKSKISILFAQFTDIMILILILAAGVSFWVGEHTDAFVILAIIIANAWMGYSQENNAEQSIQMLKKMSAQFAVAIRDSSPIKIDAGELVPGDVILLEAGDIVPADGRLFSVSGLKTDEASLTGESQSTEKISNSIEGENLVPGDQLNMVFKGTIVSNGSGKVLVASTGMNTEIGKIAGMMETGFQKTPLQKRLSVFSKQLAVVVIIICALVFGAGIWRGEPPFSMFLTALSLAVAALPEALPAVITIALAQGARRMIKQKALIRKLPAVETLGSVTYICTDKTGTLTQNVMTVEKVHVAEDKNELMRYAMLLNNEVRFAEDGGLLGDSTETALVNYAINTGIEKTEADKRYPLETVIPFDSERMRMSTLHRDGDKWVLFVKGAPMKMAEIFAAKYKQETQKWLEDNRLWAAEGLRILFFGYKEYSKDPGVLDMKAENDLEMLGMIAMIDPPRDEVIQAISQCKSAGIRTVMITGDQALTAHAIAARLNIFDEGRTDVKTGADLDKVSEADLVSKVKNISVYARVSPEQKLKIVKALQAGGEFVAMTGDGVNDAPSLKQADIGIAMGITGTDVSKEASDMILMDDNFATIVKSVREGRRIYANIRKFIQYVLSCNLSEILTILIAPLIGFVVPLLPIHILWINLVTDGLPGIALVAEPAERNIMMQLPRPPKENLFAGGLIRKIIFSGIVMTIASLSVLWWAAGQGYDSITQQTMVFTTLCFVQLGNALSVRSSFQSMFTSGLFLNKRMWGAIVLTLLLQFVILYVPALNPVFKTVSLSWRPMTAILIVSVTSILLLESLKLIVGKRKK